MLRPNILLESCFGALAPLNAAPTYQLAFDPDPTRIDWGLIRRQQATHFSRTHPNAIELPEVHKPLLEMADIAAYTAAQSLLADREPGNRKARRFPPLLRLMAMKLVKFAYPTSQSLP